MCVICRSIQWPTDRLHLGHCGLLIPAAMFISALPMTVRPVQGIPLTFASFIGVVAFLASLARRTIRTVGATCSFSSLLSDEISSSLFNGMGFGVGSSLLPSKCGHAVCDVRT